MLVPVDIIHTRRSGQRKSTGSDRVGSDAIPIREHGRDFPEVSRHPLAL
jgi:hypothetical protein